MNADMASQILMSYDANDDDSRVGGGVGGTSSSRFQSDSSEESWAEWLWRGVLKAKDVATGVFIMLASESAPSMFTVKLGIVVETLHLCSYALGPAYFRMEGNLKGLLAPVAYYMGLKNVIEHFLGPDVCFFAILGYLAIVLCLAGFVGLRREAARDTWPLKILSRMTTLLSNMVFMTFVEILTDALVYADPARRASPTMVPVVVGALAGMVGFVLAVTATQFDPILTSDSPYAASHIRIGVLHCVVKVFAAMLQSVWVGQDLGHDGTFVRISRQAALAGCGFLIAFLYITYQPYYMYTVNLWRSCSSGLFGWLAIGMMIRVIHDISHESVLSSNSTEIDSGAEVLRRSNFFDSTMVSSLGLLLCAPLTHFLMQHRIRTLRRIEVSRVRNAYEMELRIRLLLQDRHPGLREGLDALSQGGQMGDGGNGNQGHDGGEDPQLSGDGQDLLLRLSKYSQLNSNASAQQQALTGKEARETNALVRSMYEHASQQFSSSPIICLFHIYFLQTFYPKDRGTILSRRPLLRAQERKPYYDIEFRLRKLSEELTKNISTGRDVVSFVASEKCEREARALDRAVCMQLLEFWKEFQSKVPDLHRIQELSKQVFEMSTKAQHAYQKLLQLQPKASRNLSLYGSFLTDVLNDKINGNKMRYRADAADEEKLKAGATESEDVMGHHLDPVIMFDIADLGRSGTFGEITYANNDAAYLFNTVSHKLLGRNVRDFLVPPFSTHLKLIVESFFEEGTSPFFGRSVKTFVQTAPGDCLMTSLRFAPYTTDAVNFTIFMNLRPCESLSSTENMDGERCSGYFVTASSHEDHRILAINPAMAQLSERFLDDGELNTAIVAKGDVEADDVIQDYAAKRESLISQRGPMEVELVGLSQMWETRIATVRAIVEVFEYEGMILDRVLVEIVQKPRPRRQSNAMEGMRPMSPEEDQIGDLDRGASKHMSFSHRPSHNRFHAKTSSSAMLKEAEGPPKGSAKYASVRSNRSTNEENTGTQVLRKLLQDEMNRKQMSPVLQRLSIKYMVTVGTVAIVAVLYFVLQENRLAQFAEDLDFLNGAGFRRFNAVSLAMCVHGLMILNSNNNTALPAGMDEQYFRNELIFNANSLRRIETTSFGRRTKTEDIFEIYTKKRVALDSRLWDLEPAVEYTSLFEASSEVVNLALQLSKQDLSVFNRNNTKVFKILNLLHGEDSYLSKLNETTVLYKTDAEDLILQMSPIFIAGVSIAGVLQVTLLLFFISPLVTMIERNKIEVLQVLRAIPPYSIGAITNKCKHRLLEVHNISHEALVAQFGQNHGQSKSTKKRRKKKTVSISASASTASWVSKLCIFLQNLLRCRCSVRKRIANSSVAPQNSSSTGNAGGRGSMRTSRARAQDSKAAVSIPFKVLFRLSLPGTIAMLFYALNFRYGFYNRLAYLLHVPTSVNYGGLRRATLRLVKHTMMLYFASGSFDFDLLYPVELNNVTDTIAMYEDVNDVLFNGRGNSPGLQAFQEEEANQIHLVLEDGCFNWRQLENKPTAEDCAAYMGGIMKGGLATASFQFVEGVQGLINSQDRRIESLSFEGLSELLILEEFYLQNQFTTSVKIYVAGITTSLDSDKTTRNIILTVFLLLTLLTYVIVVRDVLRSLDQTLRRTRRLLLMIPEDLFGSLKVLKDFVAREFKPSGLNR